MDSLGQLVDERLSTVCRSSPQYSLSLMPSGHQVNCFVASARPYQSVDLLVGQDEALIQLDKRRIGRKGAEEILQRSVHGSNDNIIGSTCRSARS